MPAFDGTIEEFEENVGDYSDEELREFRSDDERVGIHEAVDRELKARDADDGEDAPEPTAVASLSAYRAAVDVLDDGGNVSTAVGDVVLENLEYDDPDFLLEVAAALTVEAHKALAVQATAIADADAALTVERQDEARERAAEEMAGEPQEPPREPAPAQP